MKDLEALALETAQHIIADHGVDECITEQVATAILPPLQRVKTECLAQAAISIDAACANRDATIKAIRDVAVEALNELRELRKQIIHSQWAKKADELFERARKVGL